MSKAGEKLIPLLAELVKSIGCEIVSEDSESDMLIFDDPSGRHLEIDIHPIQDYCYLVLAELDRPYVECDETAIISSCVLYQGEIHDPSSLNSVKELILKQRKEKT